MRVLAHKHTTSSLRNINDTLNEHIDVAGDCTS